MDKFLSGFGMGGMFTGSGGSGGGAAPPVGGGDQGSGKGSGGSTIAPSGGSGLHNGSMDSPIDKMMNTENKLPNQPSKVCKICYILGLRVLLNSPNFMAQPIRHFVNLSYILKLFSKVG